MNARPTATANARAFSVRLRRVLRTQRILLSFLLLFLLWEGAVRLFRVPTYLLPPPSVILVDFLQKGTIMKL